MTKSFYFQHDYNAAGDYKVLFLRQQLGIEGYGIFWYVLEQLAQSGGKMPLKIIPVLAMQMQTTSDKVNAVIRNYELFTIEDEMFFSMRLLESIEWRETLSVKGKKGALSRWGNKAKNKESNGHPNCQAIATPLATPMAKERKGKERKEIYNEIFSDEMFMDVIIMTHKGKDLDKSFNECWIHHSNTDNPPIEVSEWKRKFNGWLANVKVEKVKEQKNRYKIQ